MPGATIALTGDVMLGRLVDQYLVRDRSMPPETLWGDVRAVLLEADLRLSNLECVISDRGREWRPETKAFHFRAHPRAIDMLHAAKIDGVTVANNHVLDYGLEALRDCLQRLDDAEIKYAGAGHTLSRALEPMRLTTSWGTVAVIGLTDNEPEWEASERTPGVHFVGYGAGGLVEPYRSRLTQVIRSARQHARLVLIGAHVGPNWGAPSRSMRALARDCIDLGADLYWGHSNHTPQGIELYLGKAILYSTGDFVDDYAVDPSERNDLSFVFLCDLDETGISGLRLIPTAIEDFRVRLANGAERTFLERTMQRKCAALGTAIQFQSGEGRLSIH